MKHTTIATLGGHSALEICAGAKAQGMKTLVVVEKSREKTYTQYFRNLVDEVIFVGRFHQLTETYVSRQLHKAEAIFIPHRYCQVYCDLERLVDDFPVQIFGNKRLLEYEARTGKKHQYQILDAAHVAYPKRFAGPKEIDRLVIVKVSEAARKYERAFFFASSAADFRKKSEALIKEGKITKASLADAVIEEYIVGAQVNFNFFYSSLQDRLELLGTDARRQTNIDGWMRIPAQEQLALMQAGAGLQPGPKRSGPDHKSAPAIASSHFSPSYIETGHVAVTVKESLLEKAFALGEAVVKATKKIEPPGIIGPFALQAAILPGPPEERIVVYDLSVRMPGSPGIGATPYSGYLFGRPVTFGERVAMEIGEGIKKKLLKNVVT